LLADRREPIDGSGEPDLTLGARAVFSRVQRCGLLIAFALIVMLRLPHAWVHGRFQDEEATVFLAYAWHHPWHDALFRPFAGYWNAGANATTLLVAQLARSGVVPLERAPYLTMGMALGAQLLPAVLILTGRAQWLENRLAVIAALLMIAITPATEEVFFNVMHIQFHLALCVALILALDAPRRRVVRVAYGVLLFLAPLCGPGAILLLPLFAMRAIIDRDRGRLMQLASLATGAAVQLLLFYGHSPVRAHILGPGTIAAAMFVRTIALPFVGIPFAYRSAEVIYASQASGGYAWLGFAAATVLLLTLLTVLAARRRDSAIWLILAGILIAAASLGFGMIVVRPDDPFRLLGSERYNFLPNVLLGLGLIVLATRSGFRGKSVYGALCGLILFVGVVSYPHALLEYTQGPSWPAEVQAWRKDHRHPLAVWPQPWAADLSDQARPCSPPDRNRDHSTDPRYCESGWVAGFYPHK
jgi:hypothetical protein